MSAETHRAAVKGYAARQRAKGLCVSCPQPLVNASYCARHVAMSNARKRRATYLREAATAERLRMIEARATAREEWTR